MSAGYQMWIESGEYGRDRYLQSLQQMYELREVGRAILEEEETGSYTCPDGINKYRFAAMVKFTKRQIKDGP